MGPSSLLALTATFLAAAAAALGFVDSPVRFFVAAPFLVTAALCGLTVVWPRPLRIIIREGGVDVVEFEGRPTRRLELGQIRGLRQRSHRGHTTVILEPHDERAKRLEIPAELVDAKFWGWARGLPDLDAQDAARAEASLGATAAEREAAKARARVIARLLNWPSVAAGCWAFASSIPPPDGRGSWEPSPYAVAAAFLFPLLALVAALLGRGALGLLQDRNDPRPSLWIALVVPVFVASIGVFELHLVAPGELLEPAIACGAVLTALAAVGDPALRRRPWLLLVVLPLMVGLSASGLTFANCVRDTSPVSEYEAFLANKRDMPRGGSFLDLGPWGPRTAPSVVHVTDGIYRSVNFREPVRICLREGRLGYPWFWVSPRTACTGYPTR